MLIVVIGVLYFYVYLPISTNHGEEITVPNVEGNTLDELATELKTRNLRFEITDSTYTKELPPLSVVKQFPTPGSRVKEGRIIFVTVNRKTPPSVTVPYNQIIDLSLTNAKAVLESYELKLGRISYEPGPFFTVKEIRYRGAKLAATDRVPKGSVIDIVAYDGGNASGVIPDYTNRNFEDVEFELSSLYLPEARLVELTPEDTVGLELVVLKQKPEPGEIIRAGDIVILWIGKPGTLIPEEE